MWPIHWGGSPRSTELCRVITFIKSWSILIFQWVDFPALASSFSFFYLFLFHCIFLASKSCPWGEGLSLPFYVLTFPRERKRHIALILVWYFEGIYGPSRSKVRCQFIKWDKQNYKNNLKKSIIGNILKFFF